MLLGITHFALLGLTTLELTMAAAAKTTPTAQGEDDKDFFQPQLPHRDVYQFSDPTTWVENIAVRPSGDLLVTTLYPAARLYLIRDPSSSAKGPSPSASLVRAFPEVQGLLGIAETQPDTFLVVGSNLRGQANASAVFEVDFAAHPWSSSPPPPSTRLVANITEGLVLNGAAALPAADYGGRRGAAALVADSLLGQVFRVDPRAGQYEVSVQVPEMKGGAPGNPIGINGVKVHDGYLYFSNSFTLSIYRLKITEDGSAAEGAVVETVATIGGGETFLDDFAMGADGTIWAASNKGNTLYAISPDGKKSVPVLGSGNSTVVKGDTAVAFGRTEHDSYILYVTTSLPGKVVAVDTSRYHQQ